MNNALTDAAAGLNGSCVSAKHVLSKLLHYWLLTSSASRSKLANPILYIRTHECHTTHSLPGLNVLHNSTRVAISIHGHIALDMQGAAHMMTLALARLEYTVIYYIVYR
ncbi:hypothetical protein CBL_12194 [Carabus blaptoides fortunei]